MERPRRLAEGSKQALFFQDFPKVARPTTLFSKSLDEIRAFIGQPETHCHPETTAAVGGRHAVAFSWLRKAPAHRALPTPMPLAEQRRFDH